MDVAERRSLSPFVYFVAFDCVNCGVPRTQYFCVRACGFLITYITVPVVYFISLEVRNTNTVRDVRDYELLIPTGGGWDGGTNSIATSILHGSRRGFGGGGGGGVQQ